MKPHWLIIIFTLITINAIHLWHLEYENAKLQIQIERLEVRNQ